MLGMLVPAVQVIALVAIDGPQAAVRRGCPTACIQPLPEGYHHSVTRPIRFNIVVFDSDR